MKWLALPVKLDGYGYKRLMQEKQGPAMFGAWCAILQLAAGCTPRGTLQRSNGEPMSTDDIAVLIAMPPQLVSKTLDMLSNANTSKLLWIEALQEKSADPPQIRAVFPENGVSVLNLNLKEEFDRIWYRYPRKLGRKEAFRHFKASVKSESDLAAINTALDRFIAQMEAERRPPDKIPYGSTWFNNWQDWVEYEHPVQINSPKEPYEIMDNRPCSICGRRLGDGSYSNSGYHIACALRQVEQEG